MILSIFKLTPLESKHVFFTGKVRQKKNTLSANRCIGASLLCAASTKRTMSPKAVSPPGFRTSTLRVPFRFMHPAETSALQRGVKEPL